MDRAKPASGNGGWRRAIRDLSGVAASSMRKKS
jgi:hypothetical protein